jgi:hypothetical protein
VIDHAGDEPEARAGGAPLDFTYEPPFQFPGRIEKVTLELRA